MISSKILIFFNFIYLNMNKDISQYDQLARHMHTNQARQNVLHWTGYIVRNQKSDDENVFFFLNQLMFVLL